MEKKKYISPEMEIIEFDAEDVIEASGPTGVIKEIEEGPVVIGGLPNTLN